MAAVQLGAYSDSIPDLVPCQAEGINHSFPAGVDDRAIPFPSFYAKSA